MNYFTQKRKYNTKHKYNRKKGGEYNEDVSCLIHGTSIEFFEQILESNSIKANIGDPEIRIHGYPERLNKGAFFSLVLKCDERKNIESICNKDVILVFSQNILENKYHITNNWAGGMQFDPLIKGKYNKKGIKSYNNIKDYIDDNQDILCKDSHSTNEVVFDEDISLDNLIEIWICNVKKMKKLNNTKKRNGTYSRNETEDAFHAKAMKRNVKKLLEQNGKIVPVRVVKTIQTLPRKSRKIIDNYIKFHIPPQSSQEIIRKHNIIHNKKESNI